MKTDMIVLADLYDAPVDPASMQFKAVPAKLKAPRGEADKACQACIFKGQLNKVCVQAGQIARLAGLPDCEDIDPATGKTYVYQLRDTDPRQIDLVNGA